jgi:hypothetical protein
VFLGAILHSGVGELLFWGSFAKKYKPFGKSETILAKPYTI